ncbi:aspartate aminotransferase family protein [Natronospora cellulosivora (SeqCode)]
MKKNLMDINQALDLSKNEVNRLYKEHLNPSFAKMLSLLNFDRQFLSASGTTLQDIDGKEYIDFLGGYGSLNLGHNPVRVIEAVKRVMEMPNLMQASMGTMETVAAYNLAQLMPGDLNHSFFCNSGTEAVEGAIKTARIAAVKQRVLYCRDSFHGKTMGSLSVTGRNKYQEPFKPMVPGNEMVPYGELGILEDKFKNGGFAAFIIEPIQGEGGINLPPENYFKGVRELCDKYEVYFILDEIQTGFARTGAMFAAEHDNIVPDFICTAKSLGGGVMPIGAFTTTEKIWNKAYGGIDKALLHTSTFGGNTLATTAAIATMNELVDNDIAKQAAEKGEYFLAKLQEMADKYEMIKEVRGRGLLIGLEFKEVETGILDKISGGVLNKLSKEYLAAMVASALINDHKIITAYTLNNPNVIRFEPPLIITYKEIDYLIECLESIFEKNKGLFSMTIKSAKTVLGSFLKK